MGPGLGGETWLDFEKGLEWSLGSRRGMQVGDVAQVVLGLHTSFWPPFNWLLSPFKKASWSIQSHLQLNLCPCIYHIPYEVLDRGAEVAQGEHALADNELSDLPSERDLARKTSSLSVSSDFTRNRLRAYRRISL